MIKLKKILKESKYAWDRQFGDPLPTFKDIAETHQNRPKEIINERNVVLTNDEAKQHRIGITDALYEEGYSEILNTVKEYIKYYKLNGVDAKKILQIMFSNIQNGRIDKEVDNYLKKFI